MKRKFKRSVKMSWKEAFVIVVSRIVLLGLLYGLLHWIYELLFTC